MRQKSVTSESPSERIVKNIRRATRKRHSPEEKIRIVLATSLQRRKAAGYAFSDDPLWHSMPGAGAVYHIRFIYH